MFKKSAWLLSALVLTACQQDIDFQDGLPTEDTVKLNIPASDSQAQGLTSAGQDVRAFAQGDVSGFYLISLGSVLLVNGTTAYTLAGLAAVASMPWSPGRAGTRNSLRTPHATSRTSSACSLTW